MLLDKKINLSQRRGIEPQSPAWQAVILTTILSSSELSGLISQISVLSS